MKNIIIVGGGLSGSLLALYLSRCGHSVTIYEKRLDMRYSNVESGRSINLAISRRGIYALELLGIDSDVMKHSVPMYARMIHNTQGKDTKQFYGRNSAEYISAISRKDLNIVLLNHIDKEQNITIFFNHEVIDVDFDNQIITILDKNNSKITNDTGILIAADGGPSIIRQKMIDRKIANFNIDTLEYGYKELTLSSIYAGKLDFNCLHIWPRNNFMLIAIPDIEGSYTLTLFLANKNANDCFARLTDSEKISGFFKNYFPDIIKLIPDLTEQFLKNPIGKLSTLRGGPWYYKDKVLLFGDAAHSIVPFFGQGMNCAFEDCVVFDQFLVDYNNNWTKLFQEFFLSRKPNTDAIAQMAIDNFWEMSKYTDQEEFLLQKKVEKKLMERYGDLYVSSYIMVSFTTVEYRLAKLCYDLQQDLLKKICFGIKSVEDLDWNLVDKEFSYYLGQVEKGEMKYLPLK